MPTKKRRIQERDKQLKEGAKGSTPLQIWLQRAEMSTPAREPLVQVAGAFQTTPSPWRVKKNDSKSKGPHSHNFNVKFGPDVSTIHCDQPCTVLEAIKSTRKLKKHITCADENIIIQLGKVDKECIVATHFPCSCMEEGESLIISSEKEVVGEQLTKPIDKMIYPKDRYVLFNIDTVGGKYTKTKMLFRNDSVKQFKYVCVYGEKGMAVEEALKRDGRFIDNLGNFYLSDNKNPKNITECTQKVDNLHQKSFKVCLPRRKSEKQETLQQNPSSNSQSKCELTSVGKQGGISETTAPEKVCLPHCQSEKQETPQQNPSSNSQSKCELTSVVQSGTSVKTEMEKIYEQLRQQFPELKKCIESRFPGDSYQKELNLRRENFGRIEQIFSEVDTIKTVLELGESVCKLSVGNVVGTGFVLFDSFILTNAHLFKGYIEGQKLQEGVEVKALFGYDDNKKTNVKSETNYSYFTGKKRFVDFDVELDYAILELNPEGKTFKQQTTNVKVPQGLLRTFGPPPLNGEACIIGHPTGGLKKMDPTWIIEKEKREQAVEDQSYPFTLMSIRQIISDQGIDDIMMSGSKDGVVTYNTSMYHGASGSPVVDAFGGVFGLHSAGFVYGFPNQSSVIEFAQPVLAIFKRFVDNLRESKKMTLLIRVKEVAKGNSNLKNILTQDPDSRTREEWD